MSKLKRIAVFFVAIALLVSLSGPAFATGSDTVSTEKIERTRVQEVVSLRETNSETYLMSDGSYQCVVYAGDKYYRDSENVLQLIDNSIKLDTSAVLSTDRKYKNSANAFDVSFSNSQIPEITLEHQGTKLTFSALAVTTQSNGSLVANDNAVLVGAVNNCDVLNKLTYTGSNTITYSNVFASTNLVYVLDNHALKEYIILRDSSAPNNFSFRFSMDGLKMNSIDGQTYFVDENGTAVFTLGSLFAVDANGVMTEALTYDFTPVKGSTDVIVTVTLDLDYLSAAERAFPVVIDPSINISSVDTADACVCSGYPSTNYQVAYQLRTGYDTDFGIRRSYIRFNIPTSIPSGSVTNSILYLKKVSGATPSIRTYRCTGSWSSGSITWNNKPAYTTTGASELSQPWPQNTVWYMMTVTSIVQGWVNGTYSNYGFVVKDITEMNPDIWTTFYSSDADLYNRPELRIDYTETVTPEPPSVTLYLQYNTAYMEAHSDAYTRILNNAQAIKNIYDARFGIKVNIVNPTSYTCYADANCTWHAGGQCTHAGSCYNSTSPSNKYTLHHTNAYNILYRIPSPSSNSVKMVYLGQDICYNYMELGCVRNSTNSVSKLNGLADDSTRTMTVSNTGTKAEETITAVHEFGHMYGIIDHYGGTNGKTTAIMQQQDSKYNVYCIYGERKNEIDTTSEITICQGCQNVVNRNKNRYS